MLSSDFHCKKNDGYRVVPVHPGLVTSDYGVHESGSLFVESSMSCLGVRVRPATHHFPYNENPTRALNSTPLKCFLPSTDAIDRYEKFTHAYEGSWSPHASMLHRNPPGFCKENKVGYFSNRVLYSKLGLERDQPSLVKTNG